MITVEEAGRLVATKIGKRWPYDKEEIMDNLSLVAEEIWKSGVFKGSTKWAYVSVNSDNTIVTPHGYNVLLGLNQDFKPMKIRQDHFLFHQNGVGEKAVFEGSNKDVIDLGEFPIFTLIERLCKPCSGSECPSYKIAARILGSCEGFPETRIYGNDQNGHPIYSYVKSENGLDEVCQCTQEEAEYYNDTVEGIRIKLTNTLQAFDIQFSSITGIVKPATSSPVEYWAINHSGLAKMIARLEPFESSSSYRIYKVPKSCIKQACVFGLFKIKQPERYVDGSQAFISDNISSLISIAIGVDKKYKRDELQLGQQYIGDGVLSLANEVRESNSNAESPIQVSKSVRPRTRKFH
jgi:hypothetical protein